MVRTVTLLVIAACGCSRSGPREEAPPASAPAPAPVATRADASTAVDCKGLFSPPAGSELLCDEHVLGTGMEIHWRSYGSKEARALLESPYHSGATRCGHALVTKPPLFSVSDDAALRLELFEPSDKGYPTCTTTPKAEHRTVIVISEKFDRR